MAKTINRPPMSVHIPNSSDVKQYFFNQHQWKGLNDNKNFLNVDQDTFSDCNNVYVSEEGLLKSRPSLKLKRIKIKLNDASYELADILDVWSFEDVIVYKTFASDTYFLTFVNSNFENSVQLPLSYELDDVYTDGNIKLVVANRKIFIFSEHLFKYYDMEENSVADATEFIYIPVTKVITNGIVDSEAIVESPNALTTSYIIRRLYTSASSISFDELIDKKLTVRISDASYEIVFRRNTQFVIVGRYFSLSEQNISDIFISGWYGERIPLVEVSETGTCIVSSYKYSLDKDNIPTLIYTVYCTFDGIIFSKLPSITDCVGTPKLSVDGNYCIVFKKDGPYIISVNQDKSPKYATWRNLLKEVNNTQYETKFSQLNLSETGTNIRFNQSMIVNGYFLDDSIFAFVYARDPAPTATDPLLAEFSPMYRALNCVVCAGDANLQIFPIFDQQITQFNPDNLYTYTYEVFTCSETPIVSVCFDKSKNMMRIAINYKLSTGSRYLQNRTNFHRLRIIECLSGDDSFKSLEEYDLEEYFNLSKSTSTILHAVSFVNIDTVIWAYWKENLTLSKELLHVRQFKLSHNQNDGGLMTDNIDWLELLSRDLKTGADFGNFAHRIVKIGSSIPYLLTDEYLFDYFDYTGNAEEYEPISLLFKIEPIACHDGILYVSTNDAVYSSNGIELITIDELIEGEVNYIKPSFVTELSNYYFAKDNTLYISSPATELDDDNKTTLSKGFKWYFPEISKQEFDFDINNLHVISANEVAIFFEHAVHYVSWDNNAAAYRYYKSKLQTGCKKGADVITSYDGKYVIFPSERGLVAMTYQEFTATTEQTLTYLSDSIFSVFQNYITERDSSNEIKLFKHSYWIFVYKNDTKKMFMFDIRNNSWWPITCIHDISKLVIFNDIPLMLSNNSIFEFDKDEVDYYDDDGLTHQIDWFAKSQKLFLNAVNYYKHIVNMTFTSVHDTEFLQNAGYNIDSFAFKLQVNNYRIRIDGDIGSDDYTPVNYDVENIRTYVQRLNYSKVNEFQYLISSDTNVAITAPLSLSSITVKYKIGSQVR